MPPKRAHRLLSVALAPALAAALLASVPAGPTVASRAAAAEPTPSARALPPKREPTRVVAYRPGRVFRTDTDLVSESGLAGWAIDEYLAAHTRLPGLGGAFRKAERDYGVNALYLVAHAMLESHFGASDIARYKRNLFGYNAYDRSPYRSAARFRSYGQGIDRVARLLRERYLTPGGRWWRGYPTLIGVNRFYASDRRWAEKVAGLANQVAFETRTLRERGIRFAAPRLPAPPIAGGSAHIDISWTARRGSVLPGGVRFAVRWVPLSVVESTPGVPATAATSIRTAGAWRLARELKGRGRVARLSVPAPTLPGLWRLEVEARDVDGGALPKSDDPPIASVVVRVAAPRGAGLAISEDGGGRLAATVVNSGRSTIPALGAVGRTAVEAWAVPLDPATPAVLLVRQPLLDDFLPGARLTVHVPGPASPAVVVVRLAGDPAAVGRSVPAVALFDASEPAGRRVRALAVADPRSDKLLGRATDPGPLGIAAVAAPGALGVSFVASPRAAAGPTGVEEAGPARTMPGARVLVRTLAVAGATAPTADAVAAPLDVAAGERLERTIDGVPGGVRLVVAGVEDLESGALEAATLRLAWLAIAPQLGESAQR